jgi:O-methyltransferase involved in polyketide biosynthesis
VRVDHAHDEKADASTLTGVSETALLTLNGRAYQARHPQAIIDDPMAIRLVDAIDFDFDKFGRKGQEMAAPSPSTGPRRSI